MKSAIPDRARFGPKPVPTLRNIDLLLGLYARLLPGSSRRRELLAQCDHLLDQRNALCHHRTTGPINLEGRKAGTK